MADASGTDGGRVSTKLYLQSFVEDLDGDENGFQYRMFLGRDLNKLISIRVLRQALRMTVAKIRVS